MKLIACALPLLAGIPSVLSAQVSLSLPRLSRPAVRASLGPIAVVATLGGHGVTVRAGARTPSRGPAARGSRGPRKVPALPGCLPPEIGISESRIVYGGAKPAVGFDCSGFVQYVFGQHGVALPAPPASRPVPAEPCPGRPALSGPGI